MVPNGVSAIFSLIRSAVDLGGLRAFATAGCVGEFARLGEVERIGSVPAPIVPPAGRLAGLVWDRADGAASDRALSTSAASMAELECSSVGASVPVDVVRRFGPIAAASAASGAEGGSGDPL